MDESTNNLRFLSTDKEARAARFAAYRLTKHLLEPIFDNAVMRMISAGIRYENASLLKDDIETLARVMLAIQKATGENE